jgi:hypothetical protein
VSVWEESHFPPISGHFEGNTALFLIIHRDALERMALVHKFIRFTRGGAHYVFKTVCIASGLVEPFSHTVQN